MPKRIYRKAKKKFKEKIKNKKYLNALKIRHRVSKINGILYDIAELEYYLPQYLKYKELYHSHDVEDINDIKAEIISLKHKLNLNPLSNALKIIQHSFPYLFERYEFAKLPIGKMPIHAYKLKNIKKLYELSKNPNYDNPELNRALKLIHNYLFKNLF